MTELVLLAQDGFALNGSALGGIPGRKTNEGVNHAKRNDNCGRLQNAESPAGSRQYDEDGRKRNPGEQVKTEAIAREQRVHRAGSVLDLDPAENDGASKNQHF